MTFLIFEMKNTNIHFPFVLLLLVLISAGCSKEKRSNEAALKMQEFVIDISQYARGIDPDFIVIPQNGIELAYNDAEPDFSCNLDNSYINAIDGIGIEELYYNGTFHWDDYRQPLAAELYYHTRILVSEYVNCSTMANDAYDMNYNEGYICFVRESDNYDYTKIPSWIPAENDSDITILTEARNFLYLINTEKYSSKQAFIDAVAATNYDVILMDLFFEDDAFTSAEIEQLKTKANGAQRLVIAYMNIGSAENYRYYWQDDWKLHNPNWIKKKYEGYDDEFWVEFWNEDWQKIIFGNNDSYTKKIIDAGFDGAYLDNVEAYYFLYYKD